MFVMVASQCISECKFIAVENTHGDPFQAFDITEATLDELHFKDIAGQDDET